MGHRAAEILLETLESEIVSGALPPGAPLSELALAERFGVSRTPVREALLELERAGLAERGARRAFFVRALGAEELADLFEASGEVESALAALAAHRMTEIERQALIALAEAPAASAADYSDLNRRFHDAIKSGARNATLAQLLGGLDLRTSAWRAANFHEAEERQTTSRAEHLKIATAIAQADAERTRSLMRRHVAQSHSVLAEILARRGR
ncbi:GntR family transcriptional regulator [Salipiger sp. 1_MG-2023]|uniref:GntR family transcriptional regulator n=1 Tax=Citreicella sp. C3M06 TaxID=2841564 RepID=UPI0020918C9A|nr:GntR family transcriptional regulator [Citreicella sp. C3M06]MDO6585010.1 GntR family transcriptional regulator [Salipiger sp. 1_MG-2023]